MLDSPDCMDNAGDFSATFLPILKRASECRDKNNTLNSPLVIAWASRAHNHFVPVRVSEKKFQIISKFYANTQMIVLPVSSTEVILPSSLIPPVWLSAQDKINDYCDFKSS